MIFLLLFHTFVPMKKNILLLAYLTLSCFGFSQSNQFRFFPGNGEYFFQVNHNYVVKKNLNGEILDSLLMPKKDFFWQTKFNKKSPLNNLSINNIKIVEKNDEVFVVSKGGGMIWKTTRDTVFRIDNSFNHKMTFSSEIFVRNDTILKFGGYGYWSARNFFTYFSESTKEWEFYPINSKSYLPPGFHNPNTSVIGDELYLTGGAVINPHNGLSKEPNNNVWRFDFKTKMWVDLGISKFFNYESTKYCRFDEGHLVSTIASDKFPNNGYILNYKKNSINAITNYDGFPLGNSSFVIGDTIYSFNNDYLKKRCLYTLKLDQGIPLYMDTAALFAGLTNFVVFALLILLIILIFLHNKNKNKPKINEAGFRYARVHYSLSKKELIVLNMLIHNKNIDSKSLLEKLWDPSLSAPQNNRIKLEVIDSLNEKVSKVLGIDNFVRSKKSVKDQRMLIYFSNYRKDFLF